MVASLRENDNVSFEALREPVLGVNLGSALFRKRVFESFGMFDPELVSSEDVDLLLRLKELEVPIMQSEEVGLYYRLHADNFTRDKTMRNREFIHALKRSLDRRQKKGKS
jgi:GT2 family glycosyltransferase